MKKQILAKQFSRYCATKWKQALTARLTCFFCPSYTPPDCLLQCFCPSVCRIQTIEAIFSPLLHKATICITKYRSRGVYTTFLLQPRSLRSHFEYDFHHHQLAPPPFVAFGSRVLRCPRVGDWTMNNNESTTQTQYTLLVNCYKNSKPNVTNPYICTNS